MVVLVKIIIGEHPLVRLDIALAMGLSREYTLSIFVCKGTAVAISYQSGHQIKISFTSFTWT